MQHTKLPVHTTSHFIAWNLLLSHSSQRLNHCASSAVTDILPALPTALSRRPKRNSSKRYRRDRQTLAKLVFQMECSPTPMSDYGANSLSDNSDRQTGHGRMLGARSIGKTERKVTKESRFKCRLCYAGRGQNGRYWDGPCRNRSTRTDT